MSHKRNYSASEALSNPSIFEGERQAICLLGVASGYPRQGLAAYCQRERDLLGCSQRTQTAVTSPGMPGPHAKLQASRSIVKGLGSPRGLEVEPVLYTQPGPGSSYSHGKISDSPSPGPANMFLAFPKNPRRLKRDVEEGEKAGNV